MLLSRHTRRREFIALLGGAAMAGPTRLMGQPTNRIYRVAVLTPLPASVMTWFFDQLRQQGFVEGENLVIDRRGFDARYEQYLALVGDMVKAGPDAILCGGPAAIRAAQAATTAIPIAATDDIVGEGLVRSLAHPGGNTTGVSILAAELDGKRQEILIPSHIC
jgi:putative ABC transport system substrate-binding protein